MDNDDDDAMMLSRRCYSVVNALKRNLESRIKNRIDSVVRPVESTSASRSVRSFVFSLHPSDPDPGPDLGESIGCHAYRPTTDDDIHVGRDHDIERDKQGMGMRMRIRPSMSDQEYVCARTNGRTDGRRGRNNRIGHRTQYIERTE